MDQLEVRLAPHEDKEFGRWVAVDLFVNRENLKALVTSFEQARGFEPVGGYDSISLEGLQPAAGRLTGSPDSWPGHGETVLLVCQGCREEGCWPIFARVGFSEEVVEWSAFRQPHRPERDYIGLQFTFDRGQYDAEIRRAFGQP